MKKIGEYVKKHGNVVHKHLRKHHKKYLLGAISLVACIKIIPILIAGLFTAHVNYSFADLQEFVLGGTDNEYQLFNEDDDNSDESSDDSSDESSDDSSDESSDEDGDEIGDGESCSKYYEDGESSFYITGLELSGGEESGCSYTVTGGNFGVSFIASKEITGLNLMIGGDSPDILTHTRTYRSNGEEEYEYSWDIEYTGGLLEGDLGMKYSIIDETDINEITFEGYNISLSNDEDGDTYETDEPIETCTSGDIEITSPLSGNTYRGSGLELRWTLSGDNCTGKIFTIKLANGDSGYINLGEVNSDSGNFVYNYTGDSLTSTKFAIYLGISGDSLLKESPIFTISNTGDIPAEPDEPIETCTSGDIEITAPLSGNTYRGSGLELKWTLLSGSYCSGEIFTIKLANGVGGYIDLGQVNANSENFVYNYTGNSLQNTNFAIYLGTDETLVPLKESPIFSIDVTNPTITGINYRFTPNRTSKFGLSDLVSFSFVGSETLTGIVVNIMGKNATFASKSGLQYSYSMNFSGLNTGDIQGRNFTYHIEFSDLVGNTGSYDGFDTGLVGDTEIPTLTGLYISKSGNVATMSGQLSKRSTVKITYGVLSGSTLGSVEGSLSDRFNLSLPKTKKANKTYKYVITIEDEAGNKSYYGGMFQFSGNSVISLSSGVASDGNITQQSNNLISLLSNEVVVFSGCKSTYSQSGNNVSRISKTIYVSGKPKYSFALSYPRFNTTTNNSINTLVNIFVGTGGLGNPNLTGLTQGDVNSLAVDFQNYLYMVKFRSDASACNQKLIVLPNLYMSKLLKTLKNLKMIR